MAAGRFTVPTEAQARMCRECGIDPGGYVVRLESEDTLVMLHLKTRNEFMIVKNRRESRDN